MTRSRLLLAVAAVLAGASVLFAVLGAAFNLLLAAVAVPFGIAAYLLWLHATGRLHAAVRGRSSDRAREDPTSGPAWSARADPASGTGRSGWEPRGSATPAMDREEALAELGLQRGATQPAIRRAYRERVKAVHPDAEGGDEDAFRRVRAAYEALRRGKG